MDWFSPFPSALGFWFFLDSVQLFLITRETVSPASKGCISGWIVEAVQTAGPEALSESVRPRAYDTRGFGTSWVFQWGIYSASCHYEGCYLQNTLREQLPNDASTTTWMTTTSIPEDAHIPITPAEPTNSLARIHKGGLSTNRGLCASYDAFYAFFTNLVCKEQKEVWRNKRRFELKPWSELKPCFVNSGHCVCEKNVSYEQKSTHPWEGDLIWTNPS